MAIWIKCPMVVKAPKQLPVYGPIKRYPLIYEFYKQSASNNKSYQHKEVPGNQALVKIDADAALIGIIEKDDRFVILTDKDDAKLYDGNRRKPSVNVNTGEVSLTGDIIYTDKSIDDIDRDVT